MDTSGFGSVLSITGFVAVGDLVVFDKLVCCEDWVIGGEVFSGVCVFGGVGSIICGDVVMFRGLLTCEGLVASDILDEGGIVVGVGSLVGVFGAKQTCFLRLVLLIIFPQPVHGVDPIVCG